MQRKKLIQDRLTDLILTIAATPDDGQGAAAPASGKETLSGAKEVLEWVLGQKDEPTPELWRDCEKIRCLGRTQDCPDGARRVVVGHYPLFAHAEEIVLQESRTLGESEPYTFSDYLWVGGVRLARGQAAAAARVILYWLEHGRVPILDPKKITAPLQQPQIKQ